MTLVERLRAPPQMLTIRIRLRDKHSAELKRQARAVNYVWNYCNETSRTAWRRDRKWLSGFELQRLTAGSGKELGLNGQTVQKVCEQFARSRDKAKRSGLRWRSHKSLGWIPFRDTSVSFDGRSFTFRRTRFEPMHSSSRLYPGIDIRSGTFTQDARGRWFINAAAAFEVKEASAENTVGIDLGLKDLATLSDGTKIKSPSFYRKSEHALSVAQRARKSKRARTIHSKVANRRRDFLHKASSALAEKYGLIIVGDVSASKLARTSMAKSIHDAGWCDFRKMLSYKARMHGGMMTDVREHYTTQTCSDCGSMPSSRPKGIAGLGIREWCCDDCGAVHDRDVNAARNILRVGLDALAEGAARMRSSHFSSSASRSLSHKEG